MDYMGVGLIPLVIGISELLKRYGFKRKYIPIVNLILGLILGIFVVNLKDIRVGIVQGLFIGLSASGLYSGAKNVVQGARANKESGS